MGKGTISRILKLSIFGYGGTVQVRYFDARVSTIVPFNKKINSN